MAPSIKFNYIELEFIFETDAEGTLISEIVANTAKEFETKIVLEMYENWKEEGQPEQYIEWPDQLPWVDRLPPSDVNQWEY